MSLCRYQQAQIRILLTVAHTQNNIKMFISYQKWYCQLLYAIVIRIQDKRTVISGVPCSCETEYWEYTNKTESWEIASYKTSKPLDQGNSMNKYCSLRVEWRISWEWTGSFYHPQWACHEMRTLCQHPRYRTAYKLSTIRKHYRSAFILAYWVWV